MNRGFAPINTCQSHRVLTFTTLYLTLDVTIFAMAKRADLGRWVVLWLLRPGNARKRAPCSQREAIRGRVAARIARGLRIQMRVARSVAIYAAAAVHFLVTSNLAMAEPRWVLLLHSFGHEFSRFGDFLANFRKELAKRSSVPIDLYDASARAASLAKSDRAPAITAQPSFSAGPKGDVARRASRNRRCPWHGSSSGRCCPSR
jgi:hypothetical protein